MNLLPVYPLDGGQIARELFTLGNPRNGIIQSLQLSVGAAVLVAAYALTQNSDFTCASCSAFWPTAVSKRCSSTRNHWR